MIVESNINYFFYHRKTHRVDCGSSFYFVPKLISFCLPKSGMLSSTKMWLQHFILAKYFPGVRSVVPGHGCAVQEL